MTLNTQITAVPPILIACVLDQLAQIPSGNRLDPAVLIGIIHATGCSETSAPAVLTRIRATATVMNDQRWRAWSAYFRNCSAQAHQSFDTVMLTIIATLPMTPAAQFDPERFFAALLAGVAPHNSDYCCVGKMAALTSP